MNRVLYGIYRGNLRKRSHLSVRGLTVPARTFSSILLRVWCWWVQRKTTNSKEPSGSFLVSESGVNRMNAMHEELKHKIENALYAYTGLPFVPSAAQHIIDMLQLSAKRFHDDDTGAVVFVDGKWSE